MNQQEQNIEHNVQTATKPEQTLGQWLVAARQAKGLEAQDVALRTNRNLQQIKAIEADDFSNLNSSVLLRAIVRHYVKAVEADEAQALALLPAEYQQTHTGLVSRDPQLNKVFTHSGTPLKTPWVSRTALVVLALAVLGLLAYWTLGSRFLKSVDAASKVSAPNQVAVIAPTAPPAPVAEAPSTDAVTPTPIATSGEDLVLKFKEDSWVEIKDSEGKVLLSGSQAAGTEQTVSGKLPLKVKIGNATNVEAVWKGAPYDLSPVIKGGVARLTLE